MSPLMNVVPASALRNLITTEKENKRGRGNGEKPEYLYVKRKKMEKLCPRCRKFLLACIDFNWWKQDAECRLLSARHGSRLKYHGEVPFNCINAHRRPQGALSPQSCKCFHGLPASQLFGNQNMAARRFHFVEQFLIACFQWQLLSSSHLPEVAQAVVEHQILAELLYREGEKRERVKVERNEICTVFCANKEITCMLACKQRKASAKRIPQSSGYLSMILWKRVSCMGRQSTGSFVYRE